MTQVARNLTDVRDGFLHGAFNAHVLESDETAVNPTTNKPDAKPDADALARELLTFIGAKPTGDSMEGVSGAVSPPS